MSDTRKIIIQDNRNATDEYECPMILTLENSSRDEPLLEIFGTSGPYGVTLIHGIDEKHSIPDGRDYSWEEPISYDLEEMSLEDMRNIGRLFITAADHLDKEAENDNDL